MNDIEQIKKLMESIDAYAPVTEDKVMSEDYIQNQFVTAIDAGKNHYVSEGYDEDEAMEMVYDLYKGALEIVFGGEY